MFGFIERLRGKSEGHRKMVALGTSFVVTLGIFIIWLTVLFPNFLPNSTGRTLAQNQNGQNAAGSATADAQSSQVADASQSGFGRNLAQSIDAIKFQWSSFTKFIGETKYEAPAQLEVVVPDRNVPANPARNSSEPVKPKLTN